MSFNIINVTNHELPDVVKNALYGSHLDYPKFSDSVNDDANILIAGWILVKPSNNVSFDMLVDGELQSLTLTKGRPDVINALIGEGASSIDGDCGFALHKAFQKTITILINIGCDKFLWKTIEKLDIKTSKKITQLQTCWRKLVSGEFDFCCPTHYSNKFIGDYLEVICKGSLTVTSSVQNIPKSKLDGFDIEALESFVDDINRKDFGNRLLVGSQENNEINLGGIFLGDCNGAICKKNILLGNINFLAFISNNEIFFVAQHKFAADAIYFPKRRLLIRADYGAVLIDEIARLDAYLIQQMEAELVSFQSVRFNDFKGVIIAHGRPYHYFYDHLLGVSLAHDTGLLGKVKYISSFPGSDFYDPTKLFGLNMEVDVLTPKEQNDSSRNNCCFSIFLGCDFRKVESDEIRNLDEAIIKHSVELLPSCYSDTIHRLKKSFPVVWIGVSSQKRTWLEQETAIPDIINRLYKIFPNLGVIFDGWTSPITPLETDKIESSADQKVVDRIVRKIPEGITKVSIVGKQSSVKVAFANACDFFIANYSTGSMYVARICQKPGVGHLNKTMNRMEHVHFCTYEVPNDQIVDIPDPDNPRCDFTSYSIPAELVYDQVKLLLSETPVSLMRVL